LREDLHAFLNIEEPPGAYSALVQLKELTIKARMGVISRYFNMLMELINFAFSDLI